MNYKIIIILLIAKFPLIATKKTCEIIRRLFYGNKFFPLLFTIYPFSAV